jgi:adenylate kinase
MKNRIFNIIFLGHQGSGKGTQAELLGKKLNLPILAMGDFFRREISVGTEIGKMAEIINNRGELMPDNITNKIVAGELAKKEYKNGIILDGFPRNLIQAKALEEALKTTLAILVNISDKESITRISGRRTCPACGMVYHIKYNPPVRENICDRCSEKLIIRADDTEEAIKRRLEIYHEETEPMIYYYKQRGLLLEVNGEQPIEKVHEEIIKKLNIAH